MALSIEQQKRIRIEAGAIIDQECGNCEIVLKHRKEIGNKAAYNYCIRECPVSQRLQEFGAMLLNART